MKRLFHLTMIAVCVLALSWTGTSRAQAIKYAQAGMPFLQISVGARTAAMAGTQTALAGDASSMFGNPAAMALVEGLDVSTNVTNWIADIKHYGLGGSYRMGNYGVIGLGGVWMDYGEFMGTMPAIGSDAPTDQNRGYVETGTFRVTNYAAGVSYARQITTQFYVGGMVRYAKEILPDIEIFDELKGEPRVVDNAVSNWVFDFGTLYYPGFRDLRFGMSIRNFGNQNDYYDQRFELPMSFDFGLAMDVLQLMPNRPGDSASKLTVAVDWLHPRDYSERLHVGAEYGLMDALFLRGGYRFNYDEEGLTAGLGVKVSTGGLGIKADYAYQAFGDFFGAVHRVSLGVFMK